MITKQQIDKILSLWESNKTYRGFYCREDNEIDIIIEGLKCLQKHQPQIKQRLY